MYALLRLLLREDDSVSIFVWAGCADQEKILDNLLRKSYKEIGTMRLSVK